MNSQPRVSVVVPCHNYGRFVTHAVDSLLGQTFKALEVIVIDDASTDDSARVLERYDGHLRVRVVRHLTNLGHVQTYNEGLAMARGEFLGLLSADDFYADDKAIERIVTMFEANPRVGFVYAATQFVDESGRPVWLRRPREADYVHDGLEEMSRLLFDDYVPSSGTLVRRHCHLELGDYDPTLPHAGDWDLWLRIAMKYQVGYIAQPLVAYRVHGTNMSHSRIRASQANREVARVIGKAVAALPAGAPDNLRRLRTAALRRSWLKTAVDYSHQGSVRRSWECLADSVCQSPDLLASVDLYRLLARLALLTAIGQGRFIRLANWRAARRREPAPGGSHLHDARSMNRKLEHGVGSGPQ